MSRPSAPGPDSVPIVRLALPAEDPPAAITTMPRNLPKVLVAPLYTVVAGTGWSVAPTRAWSVQAPERSTIGRCLDGASTATVDALAQSRPWAAFDAAAGEAPFVMFQVMPPEATPGACPPAAVRDPLRLLQGVLLTREDILGSGNGVTDVDVVTADRLLPPLLYGRAPVALARRAQALGDARASVHAIRVYLPADSIEPHDGRLPSLSLRVWRDALTMTPVEIPPTLVRDLWLELLPWRLERRRPAAGGADRAVAPQVPPVPAPADPILRAAVDRHRAGRYVDAAEQAAVWLARGANASSDDRLAAQVMLGNGLTLVGDSAAAAVVLDETLRSAPCLLANATGSYAAALAGRRATLAKGERCSARMDASVLVFGLLAPGGGFVRSGVRSRAAAGVATTGTLLGAAAGALAMSRREYRKYEAARSVDAAVTAYHHAVSMRQAARALAVAGAVAWAGDAALATIAEARRARRARRELSFGRDGGAHWAAPAAECAR